MSKSETHVSLWGGRFSGGPSQALAALSVSTHFDFRLAHVDIAGSHAHADELHRVGLLSDQECADMHDALARLDADVASGAFVPAPDDEDVHTALERGLIERAGAQNVHKCSEDPNAKSFGRVKISFEQLVKYDPDVILIYEKELFDKIYGDPKWQLLGAVKNKKTFYIPREPFSWFDRPPSFMRFLGLKWLINLAYPGAFKFDMARETREFYKLFLDLELTDTQIYKILGRGAE